MKYIFLTGFLLYAVTSISSDLRLVLLKPTGNEIDSLVEMEIIPDTSKLALQIDSIFRYSVVNDIIKLHDILQVYLNKTTGKKIEPAYLALTQKQGGYAKKGFIIRNDGQLLEKRNSFYVDINENRLNGPQNGLMSITQLYPHELGHIMYRLLSSNDSIEENSRNINVHFFSLITDYQVAFNEGFAEHMENISRLFENNQEILNGIIEDTIRIKQKAEIAINGFKKDFNNPLRIGFYKMGMLAWYQPFEDYKRFAYPINGTSKYKNESISTYNNKNNLIFRNTGVQYKPEEVRNQVQTMASEGTVSTFFTLLSQSEAKTVFRSDHFYGDFIDANDTIIPQDRFTPLQNLFIKYFYILHNYVVIEYSEKAQLMDFINGYIKEFPDEKDIIYTVYEKATGLKYENSLPPQLWALIKNQSHGILAMDAYAGLSVPVYTFDINTAELEDLSMVSGLSIDDALTIVNYRKSKGLFRKFEELYLVPGISGSSKSLLREVEFDQEYFENLPFPEELNIMSVIVAPLISLAVYGISYLALLLIIYFLIIRKDPTSIKSKLLITLKYLLVWIPFLLAGLLIAASGTPWYYLLILSGLAFLFTLILKGKKRTRSVMMISVMSLIILFSII